MNQFESLQMGGRRVITSPERLRNGRKGLSFYLHHFPHERPVVNISLNAGTGNGCQFQKPHRRIAPLQFRIHQFLKPFLAGGVQGEKAGFREEVGEDEERRGGELTMGTARGETLRGEAWPTPPGFHFPHLHFW